MPLCDIVTKAVHLELVSDLSTNAFLATFKRLAARRDLCSQIHSDHRTNFAGAKFRMDREKQETILKASKNIAAVTTKDDVTWKFIPHFGGLGEAAVK